MSLARSLRLRLLRVSQANVSRRQENYFIFLIFYLMGFGGEVFCQVLLLFQHQSLQSSVSVARGAALRQARASVHSF
jgi:hypothetical protein